MVAAKGATAAMGVPILPRQPDTRCSAPGCIGGADELDHRIPLGLATRIGTPWIIVRAFSRRNLQWLCHMCHAAKTRRDRLAMNALDRGTTITSRAKRRMFPPNRLPFAEPRT